MIAISDFVNAFLFMVFCVVVPLQAGFWSGLKCMPAEGVLQISPYEKGSNLLYNGLVRVKVMSSSGLVRYMEGWAKGMHAGIQ